MDEGSLELFGTIPSSRNRLGHALRLRTSAAASWREGRPIPVNRSNARLAVSFAYMRPHPSVGYAVINREIVVYGKAIVPAFA
jgi:hypothetical protein